jgi:hypothetical protein
MFLHHFLCDLIEIVDKGNGEMSLELDMTFNLLVYLTFLIDWFLEFDFLFIIIVINALEESYSSTSEAGIGIA